MSEAPDFREEYAGVCDELDRAQQRIAELEKRERVHLAELKDYGNDVERLRKALDHLAAILRTAGIKRDPNDHLWKKEVERLKDETT